MGNIRGWAGGDQNGAAEEAFTESRGQFQKKLLARMRGFGMTAVLSGFSGHIPKAFADKFPTAKIRRSPDWGHMPTDYNTETIKHANYASVYMLDPHDSLFEELGSKFYAKQAEEWGTDHIYQTDTYNEMAPLQNDAAFLNASSSAVFGAMAAADPDAIWLMQGWLFHESFWGDAQMKSYLGGVAKDRMWVLDLNTQAKPVYTRNNGDGLYGHPYIWCTLNTYGGQNGLYGPNVAESIFGDGSPKKGVWAAMNNNSTISGVGITMEGIWTNYPVFESTLLLGWEGGETAGCHRGGSAAQCAASSTSYWGRYGARRYGSETAGGVAAWNLLGGSIYGSGRGGCRLGPIEYVPKLAMADEELPVTLQMHPDLLENTEIVAEFTWHMSSTPESLISKWRRSNATAVGVGAAVTRGGSACSFGKALPGTCIYSYVGGFKGTFKTLAAAQAWCCKSTQCGGVTKEKASNGGTYSPRYLSKACPSPSGETSWLKIGASTPNHCRQPGPGQKPVDVTAKAWGLLLEEKATLATVPQYRYDLIDFARQALEGNFSTHSHAFKIAAMAKDAANATAHAAFLMELLKDYDDLLNSDSNFQLGPWIAWARSWSNDTKAQDWLEFNARNQITLWGPTGQINDYAAKAWGGLVSSYYAPRWELFTKMAIASISPGGKAWNQSEFQAAWLDQIGLPWSNATTPTFPIVGVGDTVEIAAALFEKYVKSP